VTNLRSSNNNFLKLKKELKSLQSKTKSLVERSLLDVSKKSYKKLRLSGVGFKVNYISIGSLNLLKFELGYSHSLYLKIPNDILVILTSPTKFIVSGRVNEVTDFCSRIRKLRPIDSYKGKGILYENEKVQLKVVNKS
jgi:large subunit ribosomal protein L6